MKKLLTLLFVLVTGFTSAHAVAQMAGSTIPLPADIAAIKKVEDKVSTRKGLFIINLFVIYLVSTGPRRHVLQYSRKSVEKN